MSASKYAQRVSAHNAQKGMTREERKVILASSFGALMEWYDFYIYAALAAVFGTLFFPSGNSTVAFLASLATFGAGFLIRPVGALLFGRLGDVIGRKYTFLVTILLMGISTVGVGLLPTFEHIGIAATVALVCLRLLQGLALGGEIGGALTYVAEHSPLRRRGLYTSSIQTTATLGLLLSLITVAVVKVFVTDEQFLSWGWRIPFIVSLLMLVVSVYIRSKLHESPVFLEMKSRKLISKSPIRDSFLKWDNLRYVLLLFVICAGLGAIFGTGHFYVMFFLNKTLHLPQSTVHWIMGAVLIVATPCYLLFGWLSDRIGRKYILVTACVLAALTIMPIFKALTHYATPELEKFNRSTTVSIRADDCHFSLFTAPVTACDKIKGYLTDLGVSYDLKLQPDAAVPIVRVGNEEVAGFDAAAIKKMLVAAGWPQRPDSNSMNLPAVMVLVFLLVFYLTMIYGPMGAMMVELFPARIRYTSLSLPFNLGAGWVGGMLPFTVSAINVAQGNVYAGLWYPVAICAVAAVIGFVFLPETKDRSLDH
ncbi:MFS transporter [Bordetella avium]|uniref:Probable transporter n=1 Tax=Bordetella avium (strain 197N) TaxID=360910 RepID=Q2L1R8_BORA1|nr:MFS transporter [Bordetella avium]AZY48971.1 MFS transporter [Bordetella avium]AZY52332.1 MFS transporter [Bordetella avium]RIQ50098.1 MFS transporter [Bordetella avium]RIQ68095.1 MFS transporter [Bordetella avium]RIQ71141.1 MFS transporter [Bordetella avium]